MYMLFQLRMCVLVVDFINCYRCPCYVHHCGFVFSFCFQLVEWALDSCPLPWLASTWSSSLEVLLLPDCSRTDCLKLSSLKQVQLHTTLEFHLGFWPCTDGFHQSSIHCNLYAWYQFSNCSIHIGCSEWSGSNSTWLFVMGLLYIPLNSSYLWQCLIPFWAQLRLIQWIPYNC